MGYGGIYLAAGSGRRMGSHKPSLTLAPGSPPLGAIALGTMLACAALDRIAVVVNSSDSLAWLSDSSLDEERARISLVRCADAEWGMSNSLKAGLRDARVNGTNGVMIALADQPFVTSDSLDRIVDAFASDPSLDYVACEQDDETMPPAMLAPSIYDAINQLSGDAGARKLLRSGMFRGKTIAVGSKDELLDIDDPFQLEKARRLWNAIDRRKG